MTHHDHCASWFLAQFKPNCHAVAKRNLVRQGFGTFLPLQEETRRLRGKFITQSRPLFPGYLFVSLGRAGGDWRAVNSTIGITRLVCLGREPTPVPRDLVRQLMHRCDCAGRLLPPTLFNRGDQVMVAKGPFADIVARIEGKTPDQRIWVLMEIMGAQTRVALPAAQLRAV